MTGGTGLHDRHAARVLACIRERVDAAGGWLPFDEYMQLALYAPGLGYYSAGARKFGAAGDFTTAPEISPLFGQCLATQCAAVLRELGDGEILEPGAGTGRLAADVLTELAALDCLPRRYRILEVSAELRERQQQRLHALPAELARRVEWIDRPPPEPWRGVLLANEVLDALPVQCFTVREEGLFERGVAFEGDQPLWRERPAAALLRAEIGRLRSGVDALWPIPFESEACLCAGPWIAAVTAQLASGVALFIDYGLPRRDYYHPQRSRGTLRCHYRQRAHDDPFAHPGLEDITAWVDFTRVAEAADSCGLEVLGYATQAAVLLGLGIESRVAASDVLTHARRASEARQLLMPTEMGETFKAIALGRGFDTPLAAFSQQDLRSRL